MAIHYNYFGQTCLRPCLRFSNVSSLDHIRSICITADQERPTRAPALKTLWPILRSHHIDVTGFTSKLIRSCDADVSSIIHHAVTPGWECFHYLLCLSFTSQAKQHVTAGACNNKRQHLEARDCKARRTDGCSSNSASHNHGRLKSWVSQWIRLLSSFISVLIPSYMMCTVSLHGFTGLHPDVHIMSCISFYVYRLHHCLLDLCYMDWTVWEGGKEGVTGSY